MPLEAVFHSPASAITSEPPPYSQPTMSSSSAILPVLPGRVSSRWPALTYAATWTLLLTLIVSVASFSPEVAFVKAISPSSFFSRECAASRGFIRVPLDSPGEVICLTAQLFRKSTVDLIVPPLFAGVVVAGSALVLRACGSWEDDYAAR